METLGQRITLVRLLYTYGQRADMECVSLFERHNKMAQTGCLKTTEIHFLTVLEDGSPRSGCWQGWILLRLLSSLIDGSSLGCLFTGSSLHACGSVFCLP